MDLILKQLRMLIKITKELVNNTGYDEYSLLSLSSNDYKNINEVPKLEKIIVSRGLGDVKDNSQSFNKAVEEFKSKHGGAHAPQIIGGTKYLKSL